MSEPKEITAKVVHHAPGTFCWWEIVTTDLAGARAFYTDLFGWTYTENPIGEGQVYVMLQHEGRDVGATYQLTDDMKEQGVPPHWAVYLATDDADATARKATALGGTVVMGPFDVFDAGRMAILRDPAGATFSVWQPKTHPGAQAVGEINTVCWNELISHDAAVAEAFYCNLFGYTTEVMPMEQGPYTLFKDGDMPRGGLMQMDPAWGELPSHWMTYVSVADCDATVARATDLGASVQLAPTDIPNVGRLAILRDPQGAFFAVIRLTQPG